MNSTTDINSGTKRKLTNLSLPRDQKDTLEGYPRELTEKFQPLFCALCNAKLTSNVTALMHYNSQKHKKKVNNYLEQWSLKTGEPMPKKLCINKTTLEDGQLHCEACDLALTSKQHAQQHYMGKAHQMVIAEKRNPTGSGFYKDGKWIRIDKAKTDPTGRFGIGSGFLGKTNEGTSLNDTKNANTNIQPEIQKPIVQPATNLPEPNTDGDNPLYCALCKVSVTSAPQMTAHLIGIKHKKKLKLSNSSIDTQPNSALPPTTHMDTMIPSLNGDSFIDISMFRTPSGNYYCRPCDVTLLNDQQFRVHLNSKKHIKKNK